MNFNNPHTSQLNYGINSLNNSISRLQYLISHLATKVHTIEKSVSVLSKVLIEQKVIDEATLNSYYTEEASDKTETEDIAANLLEIKDKSTIKPDGSTKIEMTIEKP